MDVENQEVILQKILLVQDMSYILISLGRCSLKYLRFIFHSGKDGNGFSVSENVLSSKKIFIGMEKKGKRNFQGRYNN